MSGGFDQLPTRRRPVPLGPAGRFKPGTDAERLARIVHQQARRLRAVEMHLEVLSARVNIVANPPMDLGPFPPPDDEPSA